MANNAYCAIALTGGGTGSLDSLDGASLADGDVCFVVDAANNNLETYTLNATLGGVAAPPSTVSPTTNAGNKRWELVKGVYKDSLSLYDGTNIGLVQLTTNILELYSNKTSGVVRVSVTDGAGNKETGADFTGGGAARLYYDNTVKLATTTTGVTVTGALSETIPAFSRRNFLINGDMKISQRGTSFTSATTPANSDDTYLLDRWILLSDGNDAVDVTQTATVPTTGFKYSIGLDVETTNKKFGILQVLENDDSIPLIGSNVAFSFYAKVSATTKLDNVKAAIISWSGTADTVTSDIVSAWEAEGTEPTLEANWAYENIPVNLNVTTSFVKYTISAAVDTASTANVGVFIWSDVTDTTAGDFLYITGCQLELGLIATPFESRHYGEELALCQRYYWRGSPMANPNLNAYATGCYFSWVHSFPVTMRIPPTLATVCPNITYSNLSSLTHVTCDGSSMKGTVVSTGEGANVYYALGTGAYVEASSEL